MRIKLEIDIQPDVATTYRIASEHPETPKSRNQLNFDDIYQDGEISVKRLSAPEVEDEKPVAITPQLPTDQRLEIGASTERNEHLVKVDEHLGGFNSRDSLLERIETGIAKGYSHKQIEILRKNRRAEKEAAQRELSLACGTCTLECAIRDNFVKWQRVHKYAEGKRTQDQEPRKVWRRRLMTDPEAHCLPGVKVKPRATTKTT